MENSPKTYWQEFFPLWWDGFKAWIYGGTWGQIVTSLILAFGVPYLYIYVNEIEIAIENMRQLLFAVLIGAFWYLIVAIISFIGANIKLYNNQIEKRREVGEFIENPFRIKIHKPDYKGRRERPVRHTLEIHNKIPNKKIENCYVRLDVVFDATSKLPPNRINQNLMWNAREQEENQIRKLTISGGGLAFCDVLKEEGSTTAYYLTWVSEKFKTYVDPGEWTLNFTVFGDWDTYSVPFHYYCTMLVDARYEIELKDLKEGKYQPEVIILD